MFSIDALYIAFVLSNIGYVILTYCTIRATREKHKFAFHLWVVMVLGFVSIALRAGYLFV